MLRRLRTAAERAHGQRARSEPESGVPSKLLRCARGVPDRHWMRCTSPVSSERLQYFFSSVVSFMHLPTQRGHQRLRQPRHHQRRSPDRWQYDRGRGDHDLGLRARGPRPSGPRPPGVGGRRAPGPLRSAQLRHAGQANPGIRGGEYTLLSGTVQPLARLAAGWVSLLAGFTAPIAAVALALQAYLGGTFAGGSLS